MLNNQNRLAAGLIIFYALFFVVFLGFEQLKPYVQRQQAKEAALYREAEQNRQKLNTMIDELSHVKPQSPTATKAPEPDFGPYIVELQRRIKRNWIPPQANRSKRIIANFQVGRDGQLLRAAIAQSSGFPAADEAALAAIRVSAPFRPLPENFRGKDILVQFTFDYEIPANLKKQAGKHCFGLTPFSVCLKLNHNRRSD